MLERKQGFTLIELLATIIIMGIIILIVTPVFNSIVKTARKRAFKLNCDNVYKALEMYKESESISGTLVECSIFEFNNNRITEEVIDNITYEPLVNLNLRGQLPLNGTGKICNGKVELIADNLHYTCIINEDENKIVEGNITDNDKTNPVINDLSFTASTNSIKVIVDAKEQDGIVEKYYYKINDNDFIESDNNFYTFNNLNTNTSYIITVKVENKSGLQSTEIKKTVTTKNIMNPIFNQISQIPVDSIYATKRTIGITYDNVNINNPIFYFKSSVAADVLEGIITKECGSTIDTCTNIDTKVLEADTWYITNNPNPSIIYTENGVLYALISDGENISETSTYTVNNIDTSQPLVDISVDTIKTNRATVLAVCKDEQSGIIKYEFSKDNGLTYFENNTTPSYTFTGLTKNTVYNFQVRCTNGSGLTNIASIQNTTLGVTNPEISQSSQIPINYTYANTRVITISYDEEGIENPNHYFKSSVSSTISNGTVIQSCGTNTTPENCVDSNTTLLSANTWYKTTNKLVDITYTANGTLYALTSDGENISGTSTYVVNKIDLVPPSVTVTVSSKTATITLSDDNGIIGYNVTISSSSPTNWNSISQTLSTIKSYTVSNAGTYYAHVLDVAGNTSYKAFTVNSSAFSYPASMSCPSGYTQNGTTCNMTSISSALSTSSNVSYSCSSGALQGSSCYSCASGTLSGTSCTTSASSTGPTVSYSCPSGYTSSGSGSSMKCYKCSSGWSLSGSTCTKQASSSSATISSYSCSSGTLQGSTCYSCSSGTLYASSSTQYCYTSSSPKYSCSLGTLSGTSCTISASPTNSGTCSGQANVALKSCETSCQNNFPSQSGDNFVGCMTSCNVAYDTTFRQCITCPSGYTKSGSSCTKTESATKSCTSGSLNSTGTACITKLSTLTTKLATPKYSCSSGTLSGSTCYKCSSGTLSGTTCSTSASSTEKDTSYACPSGYTSSGSGSSMNCYKCSSGTLSGSNCIKSASSTSANASYTCPSGYTSSGSGSSMKCYKCSSGTLSGSYCYNYYSTSVSYSCPSGGTLSGTTCIP